MTTVYTADGRAVRVITALPDGRLVVELAVEHGDDDELYFTGQTEIVGRVFDNPPVEAQHKEIAHLESMVTQLRNKLSTLQGEVSKAEHAHKERLAKLKQYEPLKFIEDFLDGKLTHYVIVGRYNSEIIRLSTPAEEIDTESRWEKKQKLLSLFGTPSTREIGWWLDQEQVFPFTSLEAARAKAAELLTKAFDLARTHPFNAERVVQSAKAINMPVPDDILQLVREQREKSAQTAVEKARKELANAEQVLTIVQGGAV